MLGNDSVSITENNIIFDTGSSLNYLPEREFKLYFAKIQLTDARKVQLERKERVTQSTEHNLLGPFGPR